jgi:hypothetical protein
MIVDRAGMLMIAVPAEILITVVLAVILIADVPVLNRVPRPSVGALRFGLEEAAMPDRKMDVFESPLRQNG